MSDNRLSNDFAYDMLGFWFKNVIHKLYVIIIILIIALIGSNGAWIYYESQFSQEKTVIEAEQQADGDSENIIVGGDYDAGNTESKDN